MALITYFMKQDKEDVLYNAAMHSIPQTAKILGMGADLTLREIRDGKLKAEWRGKRMKCSQAAIDEYIEKQKVRAAEDEKPFVFKHLKV